MRTATFSACLYPSRASAGGAVIFGSWATTLMFVCGIYAQGSTSATPIDEKFRGVLGQYCVSCHGEKKQKGKFRVDRLPYKLSTVEAPDQWQKVLNALNSGDTPPEE